MLRCRGAERSQGKKRAHIPYRNSMMTSVLRDSLGGNCKTSMIATMNPGPLFTLTPSLSLYVYPHGAEQMGRAVAVRCSRCQSCRCRMPLPSLLVPFLT